MTPKPARPRPPADRDNDLRDAAVEAPHASSDERVDEAIDESFPASDPPSWNAGIKSTGADEVLKRRGKRPGAAKETRSGDRENDGK